MPEEPATLLPDLSLTVSLFPNSGHHLDFIPLPAAFLSKNENINNACTRDDSPWFQAPKHSWIRCRYGAKDQQFVLWLAVESNLGRTSRGWAYEPQRTVSSEEAVQYSDSNRHATPYAFMEVSQIPGHTQQITLELGGKEDDSRLRINLSIIWLAPNASPISVDLIIDLGNTRTIALALEQNRQADEALSAICQPIRFLKRWEKYSPLLEGDPAAIVDSWFILHEPIFANLEPNERITTGKECLLVDDLTWGEVRKRYLSTSKVSRVISTTKRVPQMFVEMSPSLFGRAAATILTSLDLRRGGNFFMSSPKRYLWDTDPVGDLGQAGVTQWNMRLNRWHSLFQEVEAGRAALPKLAGILLRFIDEAGQDWALGDDGKGTPPNEHADPARRPFPDPDAPRYPRAEGITWNALTILETAFKQIASPQWREHLGQRDVPRQLRYVLVTFPPGWTGREMELYRCKWQKAIDIFALTHFEDRRLVTSGGHRPVLRMEIDEAVASQLPFVYGEIRRLGNQGENWLSLVGRGRGESARARILNIDIGGGTTDIAIVEYQDRLPGPGVKLSAELLFRDSTTIAGDFLVKRVIEAVLLPAIGEGIKGDPLKRQQFDSLMRAEKRNDRGLWNRITLQVFVPIVRWWLGNRYDNPATQNAYSPAEMRGTTEATVEESIVGTDLTAGNYKESFNHLCEMKGLGPRMLPYKDPLHYREPRVNQCIAEVFEALFQSLAKIVEAFDCDLVLVNGKPSELPNIRQLLEKHLPLLPHRIIFMKGTDVGHWYPLSTDGVIPDAKTVTAAGAALYLAIQNGLMGNWEVKRTVSPYLLQRNYWGLMPTGAIRDFGAIILTPEQDEISCDLMIRSRIGRRLLPSESRPEPVYQLLWRDRSRFRAMRGLVLETLRVTIRRDIPEAGLEGHPPVESLQITEVKGSFDGKPVSLSDVELKVCTIDSEDYWIEKGTFDIEWPEEVD